MRNYNMSNYRMMPGTNMMPCANMMSGSNTMPCPEMRERMEYSKCEGDASCLEMNYAPAMAYVPWQKFGELHEPEKALEVGTIFADLEKPFWGKRGMMR